MNLYAAKTILVKDRLDWRAPHARWLSKTMYRLKRFRGTAAL